MDECLKTKLLCKYSSLLSNGKIFSFLVSKESPIFVQDHSCTCFLQFDSILDVPFVIGSPDSRPIVKYWLDNWVIEQLEFLLLGKESSVLFSAGQVTSLFFFNISHMVFPG